MTGGHLFKSVAVWLLELTVIDVVTGLGFLWVAVLRVPPSGHFEAPGALANIVSWPVVMLHNGYLVTSAIARVLVPIRTWCLDPVIVALLFSIQLEAFLFITSGEFIRTRGELIFPLGSACVVFVVGLGGSALLRVWREPVRLQGSRDA